MPFSRVPGNDDKSGKLRVRSAAHVPRPGVKLHRLPRFATRHTAVGPLDVKRRIGAKPQRVALEPGGQPLEFQHAGVLRCRVAAAPIHTMVAWSEAGAGVGVEFSHAQVMSLPDSTARDVTASFRVPPFSRDRRGR
jgi:hypothetical protein